MSHHERITVNVHRERTPHTPDVLEQKVQAAVSDVRKNKALFAILQSIAKNDLSGMHLEVQDRVLSVGITGFVRQIQALVAKAEAQLGEDLQQRDPAVNYWEEHPIQTKTTSVEPTPLQEREAS